MMKRKRPVRLGPLWAGLALGTLLLSLPAGAMAAGGPGRPSPAAVWTALAEKLGVPPTTLLQDVRAVKLQEFQAFAAAHHLTSAQIEAGEQAIQSGQFAIVLMQHRWGHHLLPIVLSAAAQTLHMTPGALRSELQAGKSLTEIAEARKVAPASVEQAIHSAIERAIEAAVRKGELTQAEATKLKGRLPTLVPRIMSWRFSKTPQGR